MSAALLARRRFNTARSSPKSLQLGPAINMEEGARKQEQDAEDTLASLQSMVGDVTQHSDEMKAGPVSDPKLGPGVDSNELIAQEDRANKERADSMDSAISTVTSAASTISDHAAEMTTGSPKQPNASAPRSSRFIGPSKCEYRVDSGSWQSARACASVKIVEPRLVYLDMAGTGVDTRERAMFFVDSFTTDGTIRSNRKQSTWMAKTSPRCDRIDVYGVFAPAGSSHKGSGKPQLLSIAFSNADAYYTFLKSMNDAILSVGGQIEGGKKTKTRRRGRKAAKKTKRARKHARKTKKARRKGKKARKTARK
jgi:hypothetical protein